MTQLPIQITKIFQFFLCALVSTHFENSSTTHAQTTCKANVSHLDENIVALWV